MRPRHSDPRQQPITLQPGRRPGTYVAGPAQRRYLPAPVRDVVRVARGGAAVYRATTSGRRRRQQEEADQARVIADRAATVAAVTAAVAGAGGNASGGAVPGTGLVPAGPGSALQPFTDGGQAAAEPVAEPGSWRFRHRRWLRPFPVAAALVVVRVLGHIWPIVGLTAYLVLAAAAALLWFPRVAGQWRWTRRVDAESGIAIGRVTWKGAAPRFLLRARTYWTPRVGVVAAATAVTGWWLLTPLSVRMVSWAVLLAAVAAAVRWVRFRVRQHVVVGEVVEEDDSLSARWYHGVTTVTGSLLTGSVINPDPATFRSDPVTDTTVAEILLASRVHARQVVQAAGTLKYLIERQLNLPMDSARLKLAGRQVDRVTLIISMADHMSVHAVDWPGPVVYQGSDGCWYAPIGEEEDGTVIELVLADQDGVKHILIVGSTGAGKTGTGNVVLLPLAQITCVIYLDGKQGDSAPHLAGAMWARCVTPAQQRAAISWLYQVMKKRQRQRGSDGTGGRWRMGKETIGPAYCLYMEEATGVNRQIAGFVDPITGLRFDQELLEIGEQGRALGVLVVGALHDPAADKMPGGKNMRGLLRTGGNAVLLRQVDPTTARLAAEGCDESVHGHLRALPEEAGWAVMLRYGKLRSSKYRHRWAKDDDARAAADRMRDEGLLIGPSSFDIEANPDAYTMMMSDPWAEEGPAALPAPPAVDLDGSDRLLLTILVASEGGVLPDITNGQVTGFRPASRQLRLGAIEDIAAKPDVVAGWLGADIGDHTIARRTISDRLGALRDRGMVSKEKPPAGSGRYFLWQLTDAGRSAAPTPPGQQGEHAGNGAGACPGHACGVPLGHPHRDGCEVAHCRECGKWRTDCADQHPDGGGTVWTGMWPGEAEAWQAGFAVREVGPGEWEECGPDEVGAMPDFERLQQHASWSPQQQAWLLHSEVEG